jgi:hypothetical protein
MVDAPNGPRRKEKDSNRVMDAIEVDRQRLRTMQDGEQSYPCFGKISHCKSGRKMIHEGQLVLGI